MMQQYHCLHDSHLYMPCAAQVTPSGELNYIGLLVGMLNFPLVWATQQFQALTFVELNYTFTFKLYFVARVFERRTNSGPDVNVCCSHIGYLTSTKLITFADCSKLALSSFMLAKCVV
jgi:hypothetical protein